MSAFCPAAYPKLNWAISLLAFLLVLLPRTSSAVVGAVDVEDKFPFVVQLEISFGNGGNYLCSGSVSRGGLVSTAAHCIWKPGFGLAREVIIKYRDADGVLRRVKHHQIFYPKAFEQAMADWDAALVASAKGTNTGRDGYLISLLANKEDIAFVVPSAFIEVEGYPHWGTELLETPDCYISTNELSQFGDQPPPRCAGHFSLEKIEREVGDLNHARALAVGYGDFDCKSFDKDSDGCRSDGQRRYAEVPLISTRVAHGQTFNAPEIWCTGQNDRKINPVQHGDSGGPRFIRAIDGRWLFIGYTSGGSNDGECASSIFQHLDLWREAALYMSSITYKSNGAENWKRHQMRRFVAEVLESWSAPNDEALRRLNSFYYADDPDITKLLAAKRLFAKKWPKRNFAIDPSSSIEVEESDHGDPVAGVKANVIWRVENPDNGAIASGLLILSLTVNHKFDNELKLAYGSEDAGPIIENETCSLKSGDQALLEMGCRKGMPNLWDHNGSGVILNANGSKRQFLYETPRERMQAVGVEKGTVLFAGNKRGNTYEGTAYIFNRACGKRGYQVNGPVSDDDRTVTLYGQAPRLGSDCKIIGYKDDRLEFRYQGD